MARFLKDRYFWFMVALAALSIGLLYPSQTYILNWIPAHGQWHLTYMALNYALFLIVVAITAWRYGTKMGLVVVIAIGIILLPHITFEMVNPMQPDWIAQILIIGAIAVVFAWLIGTLKRAEERNQELFQREQGLRQEVEEQIRQRIEFTRALVHELKTPLTATLASSEALNNELDDDLRARLVKNIYRGARNLDRRIDELLDMAKSEVGILKLEYEIVDPLKLMREVVEDMSPETMKKGQSLVLDVPTSLRLMWADAERLRQILLNLISNALKFNRKKGKIILKAEEKDSSIVFEVQDEGNGIDEKDQRKLFEPYHRLESDREHLHGLGLGLALCKTLVKLHHGQIWVKSQKGSGSTFSFSIPLQTAVTQGGVGKT